MNKHNFVIFGSNWDLYRFAYSDVYEMENVRYIPKPTGIKEELYRKYGPKLPPIVDRIWFNHFLKKDFKEKHPIIFIFSRDWVSSNKQADSLQFLKRKYINSKNVIFLQDLVRFQPSGFSIEDVKRKFDLVLSFDPGDCEEYGLLYHPLVFSNYKSNNYPLKYDVFFLGQAKNRLKEIYNVYDLLIRNDLKVKFLLKGVEENDQRKDTGLEYFSQNIPYMENLKYIEESKCILEIMQKGGTGYTQRGCEVVGLNKKLITNNSFIENAPFYNKKYISTFDSVENIDLIFLKGLRNDEIVDYGEQHRKAMSPKELLTFIERNLEI